MARAKYPWGKERMPISGMAAVMMASALALALLLALHGPEGAVPFDGLPLPKYYGVVQVSIGYAAVYYGIIGSQVQVRMSMQDADMSRIAERGLMNTLEQMPVFIMGLWLHAVFVNPATAAICGWFYVVPRGLYTCAYGYFGGFTLLVETVAASNYVAVGWFYLALSAKCSFGVDLHAMLTKTSPWLMPAGTLGGLVAILLCFILLGLPGAASIRQGVPWDKGFLKEAEDGGASSGSA